METKLWKLEMYDHFKFEEALDQMVVASHFWLATTKTLPKIL